MSAIIPVSETPGLIDASPAEAICPSGYLDRKAVFVRLAGVLLSLVLAPIILLLAGLVRLTSAGPGLYTQQRVGRRGRIFTIYKLRSMYQDAESGTGPMWSKQGDSRITPLGHFLRWSHLDELPQIINVVRGEMDFIGPRPERPEFVRQLAGQIDAYSDRVAALPGITGLAQVNLPPDEKLGCVIRKVAADRYYIRNANFWLDLRLICATLLRIFGLRYEWGAWLLGVTLPASVIKSFNSELAACPDPDAEIDGSRDDLPTYAAVQAANGFSLPALETSQQHAVISLASEADRQVDGPTRRLPR